VGLLRVFAIFLLGCGAALGAYGTGTLDYISKHHLFRSWYPYQPRRSMVLRVGASGDGCAPRYAVDNRSLRHIFVVFDPSLVTTSSNGASGAVAANGAPGTYGGYAPGTGYAPANYGGYGPPGETFAPAGNYYASPYAPPYGYGPSGYAPPQSTVYSPRIAGIAASPVATPAIPAAAAPALPAVAVSPGEEKIVGPQNVNAGAFYGGSSYARCPQDRVVKLQLTECPADDAACIAAVTSPGGLTLTNPGDE